MPISRLPRRFWLGSRTSPPLITRSNLSFGPMAANPGVLAEASANEPALLRKSRRDRTDIVSSRYDAGVAPGWRKTTPRLAALGCHYRLIAPGCRPPAGMVCCAAPGLVRRNHAIRSRGGRPRQFDPPRACERAG